jgi:DNA-binding response OmpR family regulator
MATVLIADDDPPTLELVSTVLRGAGIDIRTATDGETALRAAQETLPECVVLDIAMPRLSGLAVCAELRAFPATSAIPVILLSGLDRNRDHSSAFAAGADDYIVKPFDPADLLNRVQALLHPIRQQRWIRQDVS